MAQANDRPDTVVVRHALGYHVFLWTALPLLGALAGWIVSFVPGWVEGLAWVPFRGPIELLDQLTGTVGVIVLVGIGALIGGFFALAAYDEIIAVEVGPAAVTITRGDDSTVVRRADVRAVFTDGKDLVLVDGAGAELSRATGDHEPSRYREAFTQMGYPWCETDPYDGDYALWVPGMTGLPDGADAYLEARRVALEKDRQDDARELRSQLARLGVVVRDEKKKQYWRVTS